MISKKRGTRSLTATEMGKLQRLSASEFHPPEKDFKIRYGIVPEDF